MILINVLVIVMLATAVLALTIAGDDAEVERSVRLRGAAQAQAVAHGAELSAVTALRRDLARGADVDSLKDEWAQIGDRDTAIDGGTFTFAVVDAQARFNLNNLARNDLVSIAIAARIAQAARIDEATLERLRDYIREVDVVENLDDLVALGLTPEQLAVLAQYCTILPEYTDVNLATAPEPLLALVLGNPAAAREIVSRRSAPGGYDPQDLNGLRGLLPPGTGLTSSYFWTRADVTVAGTRQRLTSLLHRRIADGKPEVRVVRRWKGAPPVQAPPLPDPKD